MDFANKKVYRRLISHLYLAFFGYFRYQRQDRIQMTLELGKDRFHSIRVFLRKFFGSQMSPLFGFIIGSQAYIISRESANWLVSHFDNLSEWDKSSRESLDSFIAVHSRDLNFAPYLRTLRVSKQILPQRKTPSSNNFY